MAYEDITYEVILQRMLDKVPDNMDKREGSIIYDALAPAAVELQLMYIELDTILKETFADTAQRDYLVRRVAERGIEPYNATYAKLKGIFTPTSLNIPIGSRFSCNDLNYVVISKIQDGEYQLQCETLGISGNGNFGDLIPIDYIQGLETAKLNELLIPGEDEEDVESLRQRYFASFETKPYGGNKKDYIQKCKYCGKPLPFGCNFTVCDDCHRSGKKFSLMGRKKGYSGEGGREQERHRKAEPSEKEGKKSGAGRRRRRRRPRQAGVTAAENKKES